MNPEPESQDTRHSASDKDATKSTASREYDLRLSSWQKRAKDARSMDRLFTRLRIIAFLLVIGVGSICIGDPDVSWFWLLVPLAIFVALLRLHNPVLKRLLRAQASVDYYTSSLDRLAGNWKTSEQDGSDFADAGHPWSADLDVFGHGSLFQKLNQCRTLPGQKKLASWLTTVPDIDTIRLRQLQVESLREQLDLRERLAVIDESVDWNSAEKTLKHWLTEGGESFPQWAVWGARSLGVASTIVAFMVFSGWLSPTYVLLMLLLQGPFVLLNRRRIAAVMNEVDDVDKALKQLAEVTQQFETFPLTEKSLLQLQHSLTTDGQIASERISQLSTQIQWLNNALRNQFFMPVAWALGLFVHLPYRIERWRTCYGKRIPEWLNAVTTLEVVTSLSGFSFEHETYCLPDVNDAEKRFSATQLGHPLLPAAECVVNDVSLTERCPLILISGSNMSGKSTLLRSIGTNLVLTFCGARVHATSLQAFPFQLATAMRVSDSLQEGRSLFFTVVQRLKSVVDLTSSELPVLFLLDEILSGTNSHDRRRGAEAVIKSLVQNGALGLVTTHDLALTEIVETMDGQAVNMHFEDQVTDGQMTFDYQLRDGVVQRSNAIELMQMMGLNV